MTLRRHDKSTCQLFISLPTPINEPSTGSKGPEHDGFILKPFHRHDPQSTIEIAMQRHVLRKKEKHKL
jgi:hypothetical protein